MPSKTLIVGCGLAGTLAAWALHKRQEAFSVYDNGSASASKVAAGMYNPVSFKRVVEVWNADEHMKVMLETYSEIDKASRDQGSRVEDGHGRDVRPKLPTNLTHPRSYR